MSPYLLVIGKGYFKTYKPREEKKYFEESLSLGSDIKYQIYLFYSHER